ncbi:phosphotransferase system HPr-like phosphotransfer protein [Peribacillus deserti]|uniref:Phosphotransferase system HPr-like phosphotransfer protein n=1 Tax=Peribacillus deserti TaxID=673318 RepID=A0ABS2QLU6_9BACI|nr:HPr family phosphocarrier protein [Peribacillus deserti]MBM7694145.1 phosphotransferase system HPr-like phosphotransfer protein [Peribacillus deserti]
MNEIISANVLIQEKITMRQIMSFYQESKQYEGNVYLHSNQKIVDAKKLSKLVSFMLTVNADSPVKIIVEGQHVQNKLQELTEVCTVQEQTLQRKYFMNPTQTIQV